MPLKKSLADIKAALEKFGLNKVSLEERSTKELVSLYNKCVVPKPQRIPRDNTEGKYLRETLKRVYPEMEVDSNDAKESSELTDGATSAKIARLSLDSSNTSETDCNIPKTERESSPVKRKLITFSSDTSPKPEQTAKKKIVKISFSS